MTDPAVARQFPWIGLSLCLLAAASCSRDRPIGPASATCDVQLDGSSHDVSVILIVNDTMRRDRVGIYGGSARTPVFDRFARDNLLFERAFSSSATIDVMFGLNAA